MSASTENEPAAAGFDIGGIPKNPVLNDEMMSSAGEAGSAYLRGVASLNREVLNFVSTRLQHDADLSLALGKCRNLKEAAELQQAWMREATEEYAANARTMIELTTRIFQDAIKPMNGPQKKKEPARGEKA